MYRPLECSTSKRRRILRQVMGVATAPFLYAVFIIWGSEHWEHVWHRFGDVQTSTPSWCTDTLPLKTESTVLSCRTDKWAASRTLTARRNSLASALKTDCTTLISTVRELREVWWPVQVAVSIDVASQSTSCVVKPNDEIRRTFTFSTVTTHDIPFGPLVTDGFHFSCHAIRWTLGLLTPVSEEHCLWRLSRPVTQLQHFQCSLPFLIRVRTAIPHSFLQRLCTPPAFFVFQ